MEKNETKPGGCRVLFLWVEQRLACGLALYFLELVGLALISWILDLTFCATFLGSGA